MNFSKKKRRRTKKKDEEKLLQETVSIPKLDLAPIVAPKPSLASKFLASVSARRSDSDSAQTNHTTRVDSGFLQTSREKIGEIEAKSDGFVSELAAVASSRTEEAPSLGLGIAITEPIKPYSDENDDINIENMGELEITAAIRMATSTHRSGAKLLPSYTHFASLAYSEETQKTGVLDASHLKTGDEYALAIVHGIGALAKTQHHAGEAPIQVLSLRDNRITDSAMAAICSHLLNSSDSHGIYSLDVSENSLRRKGAEALSALLSGSPTMSQLYLEKIMSPCIDSVVRSLAVGLSSDGCKLKTLVLSQNKLGDSGAVALAAVLRRSSLLTELDLSWNEIKDRGAIALANSIQTNSSLHKLDLSWNAIGTKTDPGRQVAVALSAMLKENTALVHIDLSQNQLSAADCSIISAGLKSNFSLMGLHITGNEGKVDAYGHLVPDAEPWPLEASHAMTRIIGCKVENRENWMLRNSCWICGDWREKRFTYALLPRDMKAIWKMIDQNPLLSAAAIAAAAKAKSAAAAAKQVDVLDSLFSDLQFSEKEKDEGTRPESTEMSETSLFDRPLPINFEISVQFATSFDNWVPEIMSSNKSEEDNVHEVLGPPPVEMMQEFSEADAKELAASKPAYDTPRVKVSSAVPISPRGILTPRPPEVAPVESPRSDARSKHRPVRQNERGGKATTVSVGVASTSAARAPGAKGDGTRSTANAGGGPNEARKAAETAQLQGVEAAPILAELDPDPADVAMEPKAPRFEIYRMVPPGIHYYAFSICGGDLQYDPFQPHVLTQKVIESGNLRVPEGVKLPKYINTTRIPQLTREEKRNGHHALFLGVAKPRRKNADAKPFVKLWSLDDCMFGENSAAYEAGHLRRCFARDWTYMKASRGKDAKVLSKLESILMANFTLLKDVFMHYSCVYSTEIFFLGTGAFNEFISKCRIIDSVEVNANLQQGSVEDSSLSEDAIPARGAGGAGGNLQTAEDKREGSVRGSLIARKTQSTENRKSMAENRKSIVENRKSMVGPQGCTRPEAELIFVSNAITGPRHENNTKRSLCRYQFLDCLVGIANVKFVKTGICKDVAEALELLIREHIEPFAERHDAMEFREKFLFTEDVDKELRKHQTVFEKAYKIHSGADNSPHEAKTMSFKEWLELVEAAALADDKGGLGERPAKLSYCRAKAAVADYFDDKNEFRKMSYLEFLDAIARAAHAMRLSVLSQSSGGMSSSLSQSSMMTLSQVLAADAGTGTQISQPPSQAMRGSFRANFGKRDVSLSEVITGPASADTLYTLASAVASQVSGLRDSMRIAPPGVVKSTGENISPKEVAEVIAFIAKRLRNIL